MMIMLALVAVGVALAIGDLLLDRILRFPSGRLFMEHTLRGGFWGK